MNRIIIPIFIAICSTSFAQVIIGDNTGTAQNKTAVLLEFANTNDRGLILPYVKTKATTPTEGSIILDVSDSTKARVKFYNANTETGTNGWVDLSGQDADVTSILTTQPNTKESDAEKVVIGNPTNVTDGILVLESETKAMVLPHVDNVQKIINPSPGMMVFVNKDGAKRLAVYNGAKWSFWAAQQ
ncbi:MAG: hypothetical protein Q4G16_09840 [Cruoricaptor ignavus]|nr:hypothetical protein [Cruoricaptor ignavus]